MKVLLDECVPRPLRRFLTGHDLATIEQAGWKGVENGDLLQKAEAAFDAFITADKNLRYQQNLTSRRIAILELPTNDWLQLRPRVPEIQHALDSLKSGDYVALT